MAIEGITRISGAQTENYMSSKPTNKTAGKEKSVGKEGTKKPVKKAALKRAESLQAKKVKKGKSVKEQATPKKISNSIVKKPVKKTTIKKPAPAKKAIPVKKAMPAKKPAHPQIAKKIAPVKKAAPAKKVMPAKKLAPAKKPAHPKITKKVALIKKAIPAKKAAPVKKPVQPKAVKKAVPAKKAVPVKKPAQPKQKPAVATKAKLLSVAPKIQKAKQEPKIKKPKMILPECKITLGFAGMPVSAKARTIQETIVYAHNMGLEALEIQLTHGTEIDDDEAQSIKVLAEQAGVRLTVHAPYYTSLAEDEQTIKSSIETIERGIVYASKVGAGMLVFHPGFFISAPRSEAFKRAYKNIQKLIKFRDSKKPYVALGIENAGSEDIIGDLDEVITICKNEKGVAPVLDLAHYHARTSGSLKDVADFEALFEKLKPLKLKNYYMHISGVVHKDGNETNHVPIKKSDLNYTAFAEFLLKKGADVTLISDSPVLEYDAVTMRTQLSLMREKLTGMPMEEQKPQVYARPLSALKSVPGGAAMSGAFGGKK